MAAMNPPAPALDADACYRALQAHDARFDGAFFTGVTSTGIYCRPVCRVKTPRRENCRFFTHAAQAEGAGFRPCLRCRPELAPQAAPWSTQDASALLARHAARLLDAPDAWGDEAPSVAGLAARLGVSDRHLRRVFESELGVTPLAWLQTRRLLAAKQLLADTRLPVAQVALAAGFASLRRFNAAFAAHYGLSPTALRRQGASGPQDGVQVTLGWRPPYDAAAMLRFFGQRAIDGMECADPAAGTLARTLRLGDDAGWVACTFDEAACRVRVRVAEALAPRLPRVIARVRAWLDLDADPAAIHAVLGADFPHAAGLATADGDTLGQLGIVRQRQAALQALARAVAGGELALHPGADVPATLAALKALPGIGDWTAHYIALRALRWPDAFPAGDVALHKALGVAGQPRPAQAAEARAERWRPWRGYAVIRAWHGDAAPKPESL